MHQRISGLIATLSGLIATLSGLIATLSGLIALVIRGGIDERKNRFIE